MSLVKKFRPAVVKVIQIIFLVGIFAIALFALFGKSAFVLVIGEISKFTDIDILYLADELKEIQINRGALASFVGIFVAYHFGSKQLQKRAVYNKDKAIQNHIIAVPYFLNRNRTNGGIHYEDTKNHRYIIMWRLIYNSESKCNDYKLVILFRVCSQEDNIVNEIKYGSIDHWWDHKLVIPRFGEEHGVVIESYNEERAYNFINNISDNDRTNIMRAMKSIQILDKEGISKCERTLEGSFLNSISDKSLIKLEDESLPIDH